MGVSSMPKDIEGDNCPYNLIMIEPLYACISLIIYTFQFFENWWKWNPQHIAHSRVTVKHLTVRQNSEEIIEFSNTCSSAYWKANGIPKFLGQALQTYGVCLYRLSRMKSWTTTQVFDSGRVCLEHLNQHFPSSCPSPISLISTPHPSTPSFSLGYFCICKIVIYVQLYQTFISLWRCRHRPWLHIYR